MTTGTRIRVLALSCLSLIACGGDDTCEGDCDAAVSDGRKEPSSLLDDAPASHSEAQEPNNGSSSGAESTGYVLETEHGLAVAGSFESTSPSPDSFVFNSGEMGTERTPGFPGVDIQVVIDGRPLNTGASVSLNLDTVQEFGYSSLLGTNYFMNAALITGNDYVLRISPGDSLAGKHYTLEIRGHVVRD